MGFYKAREINMGVRTGLEFENIMLINCLGMTFIFLVHLSFYAISFLIYDVMYNVTTTPNPVINSSTVIDISCKDCLTQNTRLIRFSIHVNRT